MRSYSDSVEDILSACNNIRKYTKQIGFADFKANQMVIDAVIRNFEIIGEASKNIPLEVRQKYCQIEWRKIIAFRNILVHEYFGVNLNVLWSAIKEKIPALRKVILKIKREVKL